MLEKNAADKWLCRAVQERGRVRRALLAVCFLGGSGESGRRNKAV